MIISLKDRAAARYKDMKGKLGKKLASMERQIARLDSTITARAKQRGAQFAVTLDHSAAKVRRASK